MDIIEDSDNLVDVGDESAPSSIDVQIVDLRILEKWPRPLGSMDHEDIYGEGFMENIGIIRMEDEKEKSFDSFIRVGIFGRMMDKKSVMLRVEDFMPWLYYTPCDVTSIKRFLIRQLRFTPSRLEDFVQMERVTRRNFYGWEPNKLENPDGRQECWYMKVFFKSMKLYQKCISEAKKQRKIDTSEYFGAVKCHEDDIPIETKFFECTDLIPSGWVTSHGKEIDVADRISHCDLELKVKMKDLLRLDRAEIAPLTICLLDIETTSQKRGFPDPELPFDEVRQIAIHFWTLDTPKEEAKCFLITKNACDEVPGSEVISVSTEYEIFVESRRCIIQYDPDMITHYNGFSFDLPYMWKRAERPETRCDVFKFLSRFSSVESKATFKELSSSALGDNEMFIIDLPGRTNLDIFHWIKAREKLVSYKLDNVGEHFVQEKKVEMDYKEMFDMLDGPPDKVAKVGIYCKQDVDLLIKLCQKLNIIVENIEMSRVTNTLLELLVTRGQQIKVINQLYYECNRDGVREDGNGGYIMNTPDEYSGTPEDSYDGATVIDAKADYYKDPIAVLDFMSLYPSIILANNFCYTTLVQKKEYMNLPGVNYIHIDVSEKKKYTFVTGEQPDGKSFHGILQKMLRKLLEARKIAKKEKANAKDPSRKAVMEARQKALKISANSMYGFTGAVKAGKLPCLAVADATTFKAREYLNMTVQFVTEMYDCEVVYGDTDSVMVKFNGISDKNVAFDMGDEAADKITDKFPDDVVLEMEKIYEPYLLLGKKRYAGLMYTRNKKGEVEFDYMDAKGIELIRRDNAPMAKVVQKAVLDALMYDIDPEKAVCFLQENLQKIVDEKVPFEDYIMSKSLKKTYKNEQLVHLKVVKKIAKRTPGREPQPGDRVPFVLIQTKDPKAKAADKGEDPTFALANNLKVDRLYYLEHQIENSVSSLLRLAIPFPPEELFKKYKMLLNRQYELQTNRTIFDLLPLKRSPDADVNADVNKTVGFVNFSEKGESSSSSSTFQELKLKHDKSKKQKTKTSQKSLMGFLKKGPCPEK